MLTGRGGNLDQVSVAVDQQARPAEVRRETQGADSLCFSCAPRKGARVLDHIKGNSLTHAFC